MKWGRHFDVTFPNSSKQFQSNISQPNNVWSSVIFSMFGNLTILVTQFWVYDVTTGDKTAIFWEIDLRSKLLFCWFWSFNHPQYILFTQFGEMTSPKKKINGCSFLNTLPHVLPENIRKPEVYKETIVLMS